YKLEFGRAEHRKVSGLFTLENTTRVKSDLSVILCQADSVTDEPPGRDELTNRVHGRNRMACRERNDLFDSIDEKSVIAHEQCTDSCFDQAREGIVDFAVGARFQYLNLPPDNRSCREHVSRRQLEDRIVWILEKADCRSAGRQLVQQRDSHAPELADQGIDARQVASRPIEAR